MADDDVDISNDPLLELLSDALQAGPGSPAWHRAVTEIRARAGGDETADEYRLLLTARERLDSGKSYRSVRAGPGFTRKLMSALDEEVSNSSSRKSLPMATVLAVIAGLGLLVVVIALIALVVRGRDGGASQLARMTFRSVITDATFQSGVSSPWRARGGLNLEASGSLHPTSGQGAGVGEVVGDRLRVGETPLAIEAVASRPQQKSAVEVFLAFSHDQQIVCRLLRDRAEVLLPSDRSAGETTLAATDRHAVRIILSGTDAAVLVDGRTLFAGDMGAAGGEANVGVRFVVVDGDTTGAVHSLRVLRP